MLETLSCRPAPQVNHAQLYEMLVGELTDFVVFLMDVDGCIVSWNPGVERIIGYTQDEWIGRSVAMIFTPEDRTEGIPKFEMTKAAEDGRAPDVRWHLRKNGTRFFVDGTMVGLRDEAGQLLGFSKVMRDVTERKRESEELKQQWRTFDTALSHSPDLSYIFDREGRITYANRALLTLWQKPLDEVVGKTLFELGYTPELGGRLHREVQQVIATKEPLRDQTPYAGANGELRDFEYIFVPVFGGHGQVEAVAGSTRDVTDQKRMESALALSEQKLQQVFSQAPVAILVLRGDDLVVELANPPAQTLLRNREIIGRRFADLVPELAQNVWDALYRVLNLGEPFVADDFYIPYDQDGNGVIEDHWFNVVYHPLREPDQVVSGVVIVCSEVTTQVLARKELERVNRELEEFAYVASHDLQEPLRMVNIYSQLILKSLDSSNEKLDTYAGFVQEGVSRMEALIRDLLSYSRAVHRDALPIGSADLAASLADALAALKESIGATGAKISFPTLPLVRGETSQLSHVFQNLISNALKYRRPELAPQIQITVQSRDNQVVVAVQDNGIGFEQQYAEQIFGLFARLHKNEYAGTGLGLAICHRIIERYGGRIWAEGRPGEGANFSFSLPHVNEPEYA